MREANDSAAPEVKNNEGAHRFEVEVEGHQAILDYRLTGNRLFLVHTEVPEAIERRGVGSSLARAALEFARSKNLGVVAVCPFVANYLQKHPEFQDLVASRNSKSNS